MHIFRLGLFLVLGFLPALSGVLVRPGDWYAGLAKPAWTPPGWLFGPVWTALYAMIGVSGWLAWTAGGARALAFSAYGAQLALNALWTLLFFGLRRPGLAFLDIAFLAALIAVNAALFARLSRPAALLLLPYLLWVLFASALNLAIWRLNA